MAYARMIRSQWNFFIQKKGLLWACAYHYVSLVQVVFNFINFSNYTNFSKTNTIANLILSNLKKMGDSYGILASMLRGFLFIFGLMTIFSFIPIWSFCFGPTIFMHFPITNITKGVMRLSTKKWTHRYN